MGVISNGLMGIASLGMGISSIVSSNKTAKEANKLFNQGIEMQQQLLSRLDNLYGNTIENYAKYVENLNGSSFASPYVQELQLQAQQMVESQQKSIKQAGLQGSGYAVESAKQTQQQLAESKAQAVWQGEQQAKQLQGQQASMGINMISNQTNTIAQAYQARAGQLQGQSFEQNKIGQQQTIQGVEAIASAVETAGDPMKSWSEKLFGFNQPQIVGQRR